MLFENNSNFDSYKKVGAIVVAVRKHVDGTRDIVIRYFLENLKHDMVGICQLINIYF